MERVLPKTLQEAVIYFNDPKVCFEFVKDLRFPDGNVPCPTCGKLDHYFLESRQIWKCKACKRQFSVKVGTIFEDSPIKLCKWLIAMWLIANAKNGISSYEIHRALGVTQKTAWFMMHRIRLAMETGTFQKLSGEVEIDETYIGGSVSNMHKNKRQNYKTAGSFGKAPVLGMLQRGGQVDARVVPNTERDTLRSEITRSVLDDSKVYTDQHNSYTWLRWYHTHRFVDHSIKEYVRGRVHTNGIENFWSCLKRTIKGTYIQVAPFHLQAYVDEQAFRFNARKADDLGRFMWTLSNVSGKRLEYEFLKRRGR